jgi:hypothetical protein
VLPTPPTAVAPQEQSAQLEYNAAQDAAQIAFRAYMDAPGGREKEAASLAYTAPANRAENAGQNLERIRNELAALRR